VNDNGTLRAPWYGFPYSRAEDELDMSIAVVLRDPRQFSQVVSSAFAQSDVRQLWDSPFSVRYQSGAFDRLALARVTSSPHHIDHDERQSADDPARMIKVIYQLKGTGLLQQGGVESVALPGTMMAYDTAKPYRLVFREPNDSIVLGIPYAKWHPRASLIAERTGSPIESASGTAGIVAALLDQMMGRDDSAPADSHLADALVALTASAFAELSPREDPSSVLDRVLADAHANLADPALSLPMLARRHSVSVRYLQKRAQERDISISAWIRSERLHRIRADLSDPLLAGLGTSQIASRWGIVEPTHLARLLRREFGVTATDLRNAMN
jgi:AraC-like DNA-binding protein